MPDNRAIANAVERWSEELIDIGGRNRLLFYKPLRSGTVDFRPNEYADQYVVERLLDGESVRLSDAVPNDGRIMRRGRAIRQKSREHEEEQGIRTLHLGRYLASWLDKPGREPAAPIFLSAVEIKALGRLGDDFELARADDWELNPSLVHYLRTEFQVQFDEEALQEAVGNDQWDQALALFRSAAAEVPELEIADRVVMATFSYAKLPLVRDLEGAYESISEHPLVAALTGDSGARDELRNIPADSFGDAEDEIPDDPRPQDEYLILDADGSQSRVINSALRGRSLVVVGPPGTGKSQTIANLIATLAARGKSTLFVAEKRAAIDAVTKRLRDVGLEDLVLDLHEGVRSRRQTAEQLAKALAAARVSRAPDVENHHRRLEMMRAELSSAGQALHQDRDPWGLSILDLYSRLLDLADVEPVQSPFRNRRKLQALTPEAFEQLGEQVREYIVDDGAMLDRDQQHPWAKAHREQTITTADVSQNVDGALNELVGGEFDDFEDAIQQFCNGTGLNAPSTIGDVQSTLTALQHYEEAKAESASRLGIDPPATVSEFDSLISALADYEQHSTMLAVELHGNNLLTLEEAQSILDASAEYELTLGALSAELGIDPPKTFDSAAELLDALDEFDTVLEEVGHAVFDAELDALYEHLQPATHNTVIRSVAWVFSSKYRQARSETRSLANEPNGDLRILRTAVDHARQGLLHWRNVTGSTPVATSWDNRAEFHAAFDRAREVLDSASELPSNGTRDAVANAIEQLRAIGTHESVLLQSGEHATLRSSAEPWIALQPNPSASISAADRDDLAARLAVIQGLVARMAKVTDLRDADTTTLQVLSDTMNQCHQARGVLLRLPRLDELRRALVAAGLRRFLNVAVEEEWNSARAVPSLRRAWLDTLRTEITATDALIGRFSGTRHTRTVRDFREADREHIKQGPLRVRRAWAEAVLAARNLHPEQADTLIHQSRLKRRHMSTRQLVRHAPDVLTALKPCWAMSPLLVPQILPREQLFDVVIFDEASQILPADAVSSLLRGRQAVVAGDPKQLPPTTFFTSTSDDYEDEEEDDDAIDFEVGPLTNDVESVLDAVSTLMPSNSRTLSWHYRSLDERLIAFSNHHIYEGSLTTFPGLLQGDCVAHVEVPPSHDSIASGGSNSAEVRQVVDLIVEHAERRPDESLGVIAFGLKHAHRIEETLRFARQESPDLDEFFSEERDEPFFVKNLERVQGDEREAIILTVGYGRAQDGRMRYNFGPLNREGGYRRLNVAVTRAKRRMTIVSAFSAANMDPDKLRSQGPQMLREYIAYAASAGHDLGSARRDAEPLNPFEIDIKNRLEAQGVPLQPQYGASGYWIDFAAMHPDQAGRPVLAIEADGARYHSAINARERDRLRQEHLERLGWRFHRIWSTEWFRNPEAEVAKVVVAWREAVAEADRVEAEPRVSEPAPVPMAVTAASPDVSPQRRRECPHVVPGQPIIDYHIYQLDDIVRWARSDGLLHTDEELIRTIARAMGYQRVGSRIRGLLQAAIVSVDRESDRDR